MKPFTKLLFLFVFVCASTLLKAQNQSSGTNPDDPMMKAWMAYATPGEPQQMLAKSAGEWKATVIQYMDPSKPPVRSEAAVHNEMILGGRYLTTKFTGNMMGMPFEGMGTVGYDNGTKMYYSTWVDNMGTGIGYMKGTKSADGKSIEFRGSGYDPAQGKEAMMREVQTFVDDNHHKVEFYQMMGGKEVKVMEIEMMR